MVMRRRCVTKEEVEEAVLCHKGGATNRLVIGSRCGAGARFVHGEGGDERERERERERTG